MSQSTISTTFTESPPSSPSGWIDSSPPSSPGGEAPDISFDHPYAGSQKLTRKPKDYDREARGFRKPRPPGGLFNAGPQKRRKLSHPSSSSDIEEDLMVEAPPRDVTKDNLSEAIWSDAVDNVWQTSCGRIDLSSTGLAKISETAVQSLSNIVLLPEMTERQHAPLQAQRSFSKSSSQFFGVPRETMQIFLRSNNISHLPTELFEITKLTVLSLQQNNLQRIPPEISKLVNLEELNVSSNQLRYLPSEMRYMSLKRFVAMHNPFILPPPDLDESCIQQTWPHRVPPLSELCLRILLHPETLAGLTAEEKGMVSVPMYMKTAYHNLSIRSPSEPSRAALGDMYDGVTGWGTCICGSQFIMHAEERFTWEMIVAGVGMGMLVPLRWRGCSVGCLDRLFGEDDEVDEDDIVQAVQLGGGLADEFDFDG